MKSYAWMLSAVLGLTQSISGSLGRDIYAGGDLHAQSYFNITYQKLFGE